MNQEQGFVYFIKAECKAEEGEDWIKIGFSIHPDKRLEELQARQSAKLRLLRTVPGTMSIERNLHAHFSQSRTTGEWFRECPELLEIIETGNLPEIHIDKTREAVERLNVDFKDEEIELLREMKSQAVLQGKKFRDFIVEIFRERQGRATKKP